MPRYKAFSSASSGGDLAKMEQAINEWMARERPRILRMAQSAFGADLVVSFVFDHDAGQSPGVAAAATSVPDIFERTLEDADLDPSAADEDVLLPEAELPY